MNRIHKVDPIIAPFMDDTDIMYAAKNHMESGFKFIGMCGVTHFRNGEVIYHEDPSPNTFTTEGMAHMLNVMFVSTARPAAQYVGIYKNNVTPANGNTAAVHLGAAGTYGECQDADYDSPATNRPAYTGATTTTATVTNTASKAEFTINASITVYGAFIATSQAKTATSGVLMCAKKFAAARAVIADDELAVTYAIACTSS
jgi:hypothetical protein